MKSVPGNPIHNILAYLPKSQDKETLTYMEIFGTKRALSTTSRTKLCRAILPFEFITYF